MENKLLYAYEMLHEGKQYQVLLFFGSDLRIIANIGEIKGKTILYMGEVLVKDLTGRPTLIPRSVLLEQMDEKYFFNGHKTALFQKICRHRVKWQLFQRNMKFRKI